MSAKVIVVGPRDRDIPKDVKVISTVSKAGDLWNQLSPFYLGPCRLWGGYSSKTMENAWQYSKVYKVHVTNNNSIKKWLAWAKTGWSNPRAVRYPMGKGAIPEYSFWDGQELGYIEARARIYVPLYAKLVSRTEAFRKLQRMYKRQDELWLWDYDGYDRRKDKAKLINVLTNPRKKMGHAFVLAMMLEWGEDFYRY